VGARLQPLFCFGRVSGRSLGASEWTKMSPTRSARLLVGRFRSRRASSQAMDCPGGTEKLNPSFNEGVVAVGGFTARSQCRRWMGGGMAECRWPLMGALLLSTLITPSVAEPMQEKRALFRR
jgi:hypothetical protein